MKRFALILAVAVGSIVPAVSSAQQDVARWQQEAQSVTIVRDDWGIAHVHGKTDADAVFAAPIPELVAQLRFDARTFAVVMSHRYADDRTFLRALLPRDFAYLGQLGPRTRTDRILGELKADGLVLTDGALTKLHAPVGLDLGGTTPETVALAILAELEIRLNGRTPAHLRDRPGPIHG